MGEKLDVLELRNALSGVGWPAPPHGEDYQIARDVGRAFLARGRTGAPALLVPLDIEPKAVGRRGGGFALIPVDRVAFNYHGRRWEQPAAALECTESELVDTFLALVVDLAGRFVAHQTVTWATVLAWVEEWQTLLAHRSVLSSEQQLGLWGELWLMSNAPDVDRIFSGWRGPDREPVDFFLDGLGLEVKASRNAYVHHVSQSQIEQPVGVNSSWLLSIWVGVDPIRGVSLKELLDVLLTRVSDPAALMKRIALAGYAPTDSDQYFTRLVALEPPSWFRLEDVPRVRIADPGVGQLRYVVHLDPDKAVPTTQASELWRQFCGADVEIAIVGREP